MSGVGFVLAVSFVVQLASERAYWMYTVHWYTTHALSTIEVTIVYAFAISATLWLLTQARWRGIHQIVLAGAVFGWLVEGIITPVLYEGGVLGLRLAALFAAWHGMMAFVVFWYLPRRLALDGRTWHLAAVSAGAGAVWGSWAITSWLPDSDQILEWTPTAIWPRQTTPGEFALLAVATVLLLAVGHVIQDRVWPELGHRPGRGPLVASALLLSVFAVPTMTTVPWAPIMLVPLVGGAVWAMWRPGREGPTPLDALHGRLPIRRLAALAPLAVVSTGIYAVAWTMDLSPRTLEVWRTINIEVQVIVGFAVVAWAAWRTLRGAAHHASTDHGSPDVAVRHGSASP